MSAGGSSEMRGASLWLAAAAGFGPKTRVRASNANPVVAKSVREILIPFCAIGGFLLVRGPSPVRTPRSIGSVGAHENRAALLHFGSDGISNVTEAQRLSH